MAQSEDEDLGTIAWPGFVDILSSVIIMFVFFLMIIAAALYFYTIIFVSKIRSDAVVEEVIEESEFEFKQQQAELAESKEQEMSFNEVEEEVIVFFGKDSISILPETKTEIDRILKLYPVDAYKIIISAPRGKRSTDLIKRKIAVARMFNLRNTVLEVGFPPEEAVPRLIEHEIINDTIDWAKIKIIAK